MEENKIERIPMKIVDEGKQFSVRFPKEFVDILEIDPKKDVFVFQLDKEKLHLEGELADINQIELKKREKK